MHSVTSQPIQKDSEYISWRPNRRQYVFASTSSCNSQHLYSIKFIVAQGPSLKGMKTSPFNEEMCVE